MLLRLILSLVLTIAAAPLAAQGYGKGSMMDMLGQNGSAPDGSPLPGLLGQDASLDESAELALMFRQFNRIERKVIALPNGIRATTFSADTEVIETIISHVIGMIDRVDTGRDPKVRIQSPTLDILFERRASLSTQIEVTETGITVTRTSTDPEVVAALHAHAAEVSAMADRGMAAVYEMILLRGVK